MDSDRHPLTSVGEEDVEGVDDTVRAFREASRARVARYALGGSDGSSESLLFGGTFVDITDVGRFASVSEIDDSDERSGGRADSSFDDDGRRSSSDADGRTVGRFTGGGIRVDSFADVDGPVAASLRRCSFTSSTSTTSSSCGSDSIQLEPAGFTLYAGWQRRPSQGQALGPGMVQPPPGFGPMANTPSMARRLSGAIVGVAGVRKASVGILELGGRASRRASSTLHDVRDFAAAAVAMSRKASAHVIEALELQDLPGLRRLTQQADGVPFHRVSLSSSTRRDIQPWP